MGERRSFPDPDATDPGDAGSPRGTELPTYEVNVRVPKAEVSAAELPELEIALFRIKEDLPDAAPALARRNGRSARSSSGSCAEVGRLKGIKPDKLAKPVADKLKEAFR